MCIRGVLHTIICKPEHVTDGEELPNIFGSDVYCILLSANPSTYHRWGGATQYLWIRCVLHFIIVKPKHFSLMGRSYPISLDPICMAYYYLQARTFAIDGGGATQYLWIRCVLHIIICKPKHLPLTGRSYPIYFDPTCITYYYFQAQAFLTDAEELPYMFASDAY